MRVADGKVIEHWANRDDLGTALQLGWAPPRPLYLARAALAKRRATTGAPAAPAGARRGGVIAPKSFIDDRDERSPMRRLILAAVLALTVTGGTADGALAQAAGLPDAEIFASRNTAVITDPDDPRLDDRLCSFGRQVERIIEHGGGEPRGSRLLDGVFFSSELQTVTFERSRDFDIDDVARSELHDIAERIRRRFDQQSVLTFDYPQRPAAPIDAVEIELPGMDAQRLRDGLLADAQARERLFGGSVTLDGRLVLIAAQKDLSLVKRFVTDIGGDFDAATIRFGHREFVG